MFASVDRLLNEAVHEAVIPGFSLCIRSSDAVHHESAGGLAEIRPSPRQATVDTVWDLASLTKVLASTPIAMVSVDRGEFLLDTPVQSVLPDAHKGITFAHLLSHSSGAAAWLPFAERLGSLPHPGAREAVLSAAQQHPLEAAPGEQYRYSDLGFLTLCAALEAVTGERLDALFESRVRKPSQADLSWGHPAAAATEDCPSRQRVVVGEVHDLNAWLMGGVSTHAGLFGTARSVAENVAWQLRAFRGNESEGLSPKTVQMFLARSGAGSHRMGWDGVSAGGSAGPAWPTNGFGHLAFTGCSIWVAPDYDLIAVMLTNRIHPVIEGGAVPNAPIHPRYAAFRTLRQTVHTAIARAVGLAGGAPKG